MHAQFEPRYSMKEELGSTQSQSPLFFLGVAKQNG